MRYGAALVAAFVGWWLQTVTTLAVIGGIVLVGLFTATWVQMRALAQAQRRTDERISDLERAIGTGDGG